MSGRARMGRGPARPRRPVGGGPARRRGLSGGRGPAGERGSASVELVILTAVSFLFVALIVFAGRLNVGSAHAEAAARSAARTISVARDPGAAVADAQADAEATVEVGTAMCQTMGFDAAITAEDVTVTIECHVDLSEASLLEVPGTMSVTATAREVIDQYREQAP